MNVLNRTAPAITKAINVYFDQHIEYLVSLSDRWQDESEYEDFADYAAAIKKTLPPRFVVEAFTKRPFGFKFRIANDENNALFSLFIKSSAIGWNRLQ
jgi:hypothetical protein